MIPHTPQMYATGYGVVGKNEGVGIMTIERDPASEEETVKMPKPQIEENGEHEEEFDPEKTLVREDWESTVIRRMASRVAEVHEELEASDGERFGWESEGLRRLAEGLRRVGSA